LPWLSLEYLWKSKRQHFNVFLTHASTSVAVLQEDGGLVRTVRDYRCIVITHVTYVTRVFFLLLILRWDYGYCGHYWPIVPAPDNRWWWLWRTWWNEDWHGKPKYTEKTWPSATLSTTNPTWLGPGLNPGRRGGKPATNRLSYGAAHASVEPAKWTDQTSRCARS
jgi:hypothetical protein